MSGKIIGSCGFSHPHGSEEIELSYLFARNVWGNGFATDAARECLSFGFEKLGFREIIAVIDLENAASQKILEKIGLVKRGVEIHKNQESLVYLAINNTK